MGSDLRPVALINMIRRCRLKAVVRVVSLAMAGLTTGCTPESQSWLDEHVDRVTQDEVLQRFGAPLYVARLRDGREVWTFPDRGLGYSRDMGAGFCREYVLTFDERKLLRRWERLTC